MVFVLTSSANVYKKKKLENLSRNLSQVDRYFMSFQGGLVVLQTFRKEFLQSLSKKLLLSPFWIHLQISNTIKFLHRLLRFFVKIYPGKSRKKK